VNVIGSRGYVGTRTVLDHLRITPDDFATLERFAAASFTAPVPADNECVRRLELAGLLFVTWDYRREIHGRGDWLTCIATEAGHALLDIVTRVHAGRDGLINAERI
jgi:hypothetical protein